MRKKCLLIVEDNAVCQGEIKRTIKPDYDFKLAEDKKTCFELMSKNHFDLILLDIGLPDSTGTDIVSEVRTTYPDVPIIVITQEDDPDISAEIIKQGANDYVQKTRFFKNKLILLNKIEMQFQVQEAKHISQAQAEQIAYLERDTIFPNIIEYKSAYLQAEIAFKGGLSLLLNGETGVGKSMLVRTIHKKLMPNKPLITVDCGGVCTSLIESELFGHEKGAFTGADTSKTGKIQLADKGILFLDEISNANLDLQLKLLRVLQEKKICRLGSNKEIPVDFMLITATNKNLLDLIQNGKFKEDLFFRIKQIEIKLPALKENKTALHFFIWKFVEKYNAQYKAKFELTQKITDELVSQIWPGNLRELDLEIQRIVFTHHIGENPEILSLKKIKAVPNQKNYSELKDKFYEAEKIKMIETLQKNRFVISAAARELGIPRTTLQSRIEKLNVSF